MPECPSCRTIHERRPNFCENCGYQFASDPKADVGPRKRLTPTVKWALAAGAIALFIWANLIRNPPGDSKNAPAMEQARMAAMTPEQRAEEEKKRIDAAALEEENRLQRLGLRWNYEESPDKMGRGTIKHAIVKSTNEIEFGFPYQGSQRGTLQLRVHPKYGKDVILSVEHGQFLCGVDRCPVAVRFDNGVAQTYDAGEPADHSTTYLFLHNYDRFVGSLRKSKRVSIEAHFYQEATRVFEFDTRGFKW